MLRKLCDKADIQCVMFHFVYLFHCKWLRFTASVCITCFLFFERYNAENEMLLFRLQLKVAVVQHSQTASHTTPNR